MGIIKKSISHSRFPLQEAPNRIQEKFNILFNDHHNKNKHFAETHILSNPCDDVDSIISNTNNKFTFFQNIKLSNTNYIISTSVSKNNYIMLITYEIAMVKNIFKCQNGSIFLNVLT